MEIERQFLLETLPALLVECELLSQGYVAFLLEIRILIFMPFINTKDIEKTETEEM